MSPFWKHERQWAGKWQMVCCYAALCGFRDKNHFHVCIQRRKSRKGKRKWRKQVRVVFSRYYLSWWGTHSASIHHHFSLFIYTYIIWCAFWRTCTTIFYSISFHRKTNLMMVWVAYLDPKGRLKCMQAMLLLAHIFFYLLFHYILF